ncbi:MAG: C-factor, partial [Hydrogenophaga sp.]|nr:C-factor [Hydrogenophaga sp.]
MTASAPSTSGLAVVVGAGGALGAALLAQLQHEGPYDRVLGLGRAGEIHIDYADEASIAAAAQAVANMCAESGLALRLLLVATGFLHGAQGQPERSWRHLDAGYLQQVFLVNTFGPVLLIKHFFPLLPRQGRCVAG